MTSPPSAKALGKRRAFGDAPLSHPARRPAPPFAPTSFRYHTPLLAHYSCVNALACSTGNSSLLATGGDDMVVQLWRLGNLTSDETPIARYRGARANIFSIAFDSENRKMYSCGADATVYCHDLERSGSTSTSGAPCDVWIDHEDSVHAVKCHPTDPHLFLTASDDGTVMSFDNRTDGRAVGVLAERTEMNDVAYHPLQPTQFATADGDGRLLLHDARMAWSQAASSEMKMASEVAVLRYCTGLVKPHKPAEPNPLLPNTGITTFTPATPSCSSLAFSPDGSLICATLSQYLPTLFEISSHEPLATFSSSRAEGRGYRNTTTTKKGSFGEIGDKLWYAAGSDDFNAYVWEVPSIQALKEGRKLPRETAADWFDGDKGKVAFKTGTVEWDPFTIPVSLSTPSSILSAHRSIVNSALFHPTLPLLFTSGIEKVVQVHSPTPFAGPSQPFVPRVPRPRKGGLDTRDEDEEEALGLAEDKEALEYFDALLEDHDGKEEALWRDGHGRGCLGLDEGAFGSDEDDSGPSEDEENSTSTDRDLLHSHIDWDEEQDSDSGLDDEELEALFDLGSALGRPF